MVIPHQTDPVEDQKASSVQAPDLGTVAQHQAFAARLQHIVGADVKFRWGHVRTPTRPSVPMERVLDQRDTNVLEVGLETVAAVQAIVEVPQVTAQLAVSRNMGLVRPVDRNFLQMAVVEDRTGISALEVVLEIAAAVRATVAALLLIAQDLVKPILVLVRVAEILTRLQMAHVEDRKDIPALVHLLVPAVLPEGTAAVQ